MKRIKQALEQARKDGILKKSSVVSGGEASSVSNISFEHHESSANPPSRLNLSTVELNKDILKKNHIFRGRESDSFSMAYKMLRTQVYQKMQLNNWSTLGVTSATSGEGKSITAINLAFSLSRASTKPIVLLDLDLRRPTLVNKLGISTQYGITNYLLNGVSLDGVLLRVGENLILAPGTDHIKNASEVLGSTSIIKLLRDLKDAMPDALLIFDLPPVLVVDDVLALSPMLDACLVVVEEGRTKEEELQQALDLLKMTELLGIVLNRSGEVAKNHYYENY